MSISVDHLDINLCYFKRCFAKKETVPPQGVCVLPKTLTAKWIISWTSFLLHMCYVWVSKSALMFNSFISKLVMS